MAALYMQTWNTTEREIRQEDLTEKLLLEQEGSLQGNLLLPLHRNKISLK
jgi:hypothetical protein